MYVCLFTEHITPNALFDTLKLMLDCMEIRQGSDGGQVSCGHSAASIDAYKLYYKRADLVPRANKQRVQQTTAMLISIEWSKQVEVQGI